MPATTPSSTSTSADPTTKSSATTPDAPTEAPPEAAAAPATAYAVGDVARAPGGALALVVKVTPPAEVDAGPIYDTVELHGAVTRYFAEDLDAEPAGE